MTTDNKTWGEEYDELWEHWIYLSDIKTGVNFNRFKSGIKSVLKDQIHKAKLEILDEAIGKEYEIKDEWDRYFQGRKNGYNKKRKEIINLKSKLKD